VESIDVPTIYEVPLKMQDQKLDEVVLEKLHLPCEGESDMTSWKEFVERVKNPKDVVNIALVGKYTELPDAYKSIVEAFIHAGAVNDVKVKVEYVNAESVGDENAAEKLGGWDGILVAPGFGHRGLAGKLVAVRYARENKIPFMGICLGMQCAVIEFARNVIGFKDANSSEMETPTEHAVIDLMEEQKNVTDKGGTMRLGAYPCRIKRGSHLYEAYGQEVIFERHRHRYEFNSSFLEEFEKAGMKATGVNPDTGLVEAVEVEGHPWFVGVQFHPEYKSNVKHPHPLFVGFVGAAIENSKK
jgi:CTP synthase